MKNIHTICLTCLWLCAPFLASAQTDGEQFGNWLYSCSDGPCQGYFSLQHPEDNVTALSLGLLRNEAAEQSTLIITLPKMTALRPGVQVTLPGLPPFSVSFEFCNNGGCTGFAVLQPEQLAALNEEADIEIRFFQYGTTAPNSYTIPITGFAALHERLGSP